MKCGVAIQGSRATVSRHRGLQVFQEASNEYAPFVPPDHTDPDQRHVEQDVQDQIITLVDQRVADMLAAPRMWGSDEAIEME